MAKQFLLKENVPVYGWTEGVLVDDKTTEQLRNMAKMRIVHHHIAVMPDCHWGCGSTVGSVIPTVSAIVPASVGVDIGCGMMARKTSLKASDLPDNLHALRCDIEKAVPHGRTDDGGNADRGAWHDPEANNIGWLKMRAANDQGINLLERLALITQKHDKLEKAAKRAPNHIGTLGTGNHFIELCLDEEDNVWVMLHSGSRGIGNKIGTYFIEIAKKEMRGWHINLPDEDLSYFKEGTKYFDDYIDGVHWAQEFAVANRESMMFNVLEVLSKHFPEKFTGTTEEAVNCHHNYVTKEHHYGKNVWLTRKGAVQARKGTMGIIPGSMGAKSFIVRGKGNPESFNSCSHGAGRVMSRGEAFKKISLEQHAEDTAGVECKKDASVLDESPKAYKPIEKVMAAQNDLVEIVHTLKQVLCVKG
jgi:tRNA-splicing ligase RtcB (3'-phosphate/5'-hydroxy nucleic acid ligase)